MVRGDAELIKYLALNHIDFSGAFCPLPWTQLEKAVPLHWAQIENKENNGKTEIPKVLRENPELLSLIGSRVGQPKPLSQLALDAVRVHFRRNRIPFVKMCALPLPASIISKLRYEIVAIKSD